MRFSVFVTCSGKEARARACVFFTVDNISSVPEPTKMLFKYTMAQVGAVTDAVTKNKKDSKPTTLRLTALL